MNKIELIEFILLKLRDDRKIESILLSFNNYNFEIMSDLPYEARNHFFEFASDFENNKKYIRQNDLGFIYQVVRSILHKIDKLLSSNSDDPRKALLSIMDSIKKLPNIKTLDFIPIGETFHQRKKKSNPQYIDRGILLYPGNMQTISNGKGFSMSEPMTQEDMFYYALYWDKIMVSSSVINVDLPCDNEFIRQGILEKLYSLQYPKDSPYKLEGQIRNFADHELWVFGDVAKQKIDTPEEDWTICHLNDEPQYMPEHRKTSNMTRLRLSECLPYPIVNDENNVEKLLNFKLKRAPELAALHDSIDGLVNKLPKDTLHALKEGEIKRFDNAIKELDKTLLERFSFTGKRSLELNLNFDIATLAEKVPAISAALYADNNSNTGFPYWTTAVALTSFISIKKVFGITFNQYAEDDIKLDYISKAKSANIIQ